MADRFRTCRDGHRCEHNSICVEAQEGSYYCDCSVAQGGVFAGLSCEFEAEEYCETLSESGVDWFCTNQGTCDSSGSGGLIDYKCNCPPEYEGPHCEYIKGAKPDDWPDGSTLGPQRGSSAGGLETGIMIAIIVVSALVVAMLAFLVLRKVKGKKGDFGMKDDSEAFRIKAGQNAPKDQSEALQIEMDGSGFRERVLDSVSGTNGTEVEMGSETAPKSNSNGCKANGNGNGHGRFL